jgi:hypothetical protein
MFFLRNVLELSNTKANEMAITLLLIIAGAAAAAA